MIITAVYNPANWDIWFDGTPESVATKKTASVKDWCKDNSADICYNLAFFEMMSGKTVNHVIAKNQVVHKYGGSTERLTVSSGNTCGGYELGIKDNDVVAKNTGTRTRNGIGITRTGKIIVAQSSTKCTEHTFCNKVAMQVSEYWKDSVKLFLMEDGGTSTAMYSDITKCSFTPEGGRKVATVTCLKWKVPIMLSPMKVGSNGEGVRYYQMILGCLECDGSYGSQTYKRTKEVQKALKSAGLYSGSIDGCAGPLTLKALGLAR